MSPSERALLLDLYELTMARSYLARGMCEPATFDLFVRHLPAGRAFLVVCGIEAALGYLEELAFDAQARERLGALGILPGAFLEELASLRFTGDVWAMPEGEVAFAGEPLLRVTAPLPEAQLVETFLLNAVLFETMIASKAARITLAAAGRPFVEFGMRRAHGADAALRGARAAYVGGASGTSDVLAAALLGIPAAGTMAHSYVMAFPSEIQAFRAFAADHPGRAVLLVDTWDTLAGTRAAAVVAREAADEGRPVRGVRLDSGDLHTLAPAVRRILDDAGLPGVEIVASGDLDEHAIAALVRGGAPIDAFGVGTQLAASADAPWLGGVYKLAEYAGVPRCKSSPGKATLPGRKQVLRRAPGGRIAEDAIVLEGEELEGARPLLVPVMRAGRRVRQPEPLRVARERTLARLAALPQDLREGRASYPVHTSAALERLAASAQARRGEV